FKDSTLDNLPFVQPTGMTLTSPPPALTSHSHSTHLSIENLKEDSILLRNENDLLKSQVKKLSEELETYKNPGTCALHLALKYPISQVQNSQEASESVLPPPKKKRKILPFA
ncbi:14906_t:CDS:1, partial [Dentiscutata heterogama]